MQLKGIYLFETYAHVVRCTNMFLMLILEILLKLKSNQRDITAAFLHVKLEENEKIFFDMPKVFEQNDKRGKRNLLRLKKTLYGLCQIPRAFLKYLTQKLISSRMLWYNIYPCLFIGDKFLCIFYAEDLIFWENDESNIHDF